MMRNATSVQSLPKFVLHPLIHTLLEFTLAQDVEKKKAEPRTPQYSLKNE